MTIWIALCFGYEKYEKTRSHLVENDDVNVEGKKCKSFDEKNLEKQEVKKVSYKTRQEQQMRVTMPVYSSLDLITTVAARMMY